jgi:hypothetical protein
MKENDPIWAPGPDSRGGMFRATFIEVAIGEPDIVNGVSRDTAWVRYEEGEPFGTTARFPISQLAIRNPNDTG